MGDGAPGCFDHTVIGKGLTHSQLFGWEVVMTFTLISVVYACGVAKPGHGSFTPLVVGLSLVACAGTGALWLAASEDFVRVCAVSCCAPAARFVCPEDANAAAEQNDCQLVLMQRSLPYFGWAAPGSQQMCMSEVLSMFPTQAMHMNLRCSACCCSWRPQ
jgi:hypothetical protein